VKVCWSLVVEVNGVNGDTREVVSPIISARSCRNS